MRDNKISTDIERDEETKQRDEETKQRDEETKQRDDKQSTTNIECISTCDVCDVIHNNQ